MSFPCLSPIFQGTSTHFSHEIWPHPPEVALWACSTMSNLSHSSIHVTIMENNQRGFASQFQRALLQVADSTTVQKKKKTRCHFLTLTSLSSFFFLLLLWFGGRIPLACTCAHGNCFHSFNYGSHYKNEIKTQKHEGYLWPVCLPQLQYWY